MSNPTKKQVKIYTRTNEQFVRAANEDDDRRIWLYASGETKTSSWIYANSAYEKLVNPDPFDFSQKKNTRRGGWRMAFNVNLRTNQELYYTKDNFRDQWKGSAGFFIASLTKTDFDGKTTWAIRVSGSDDTSLVKTEIPEKKVENLWERSTRPFVTVHTFLNDLGFKYD